MSHMTMTHKICISPTCLIPIETLISQLAQQPDTPMNPIPCARPLHNHPVSAYFRASP